MADREGYVPQTGFQGSWWSPGGRLDDRKPLPCCRKEAGTSYDAGKRDDAAGGDDDGDGGDEDADRVADDSSDDNPDDGAGGDGHDGISGDGS